VADRVRRRVLLIDDTPEVAQLLTYALRDRGYDVAVSGYTTSIDDLVLDEHADAVVLNCSVFNMSESLLDILRDHPASADLPVVIVSDTPEQADASLASRDAQHVLLVPKPFTGSQIARALDELLDQRARPGAS
jgi:DNA-binding response OmpR family regulator